MSDKRPNGMQSNAENILRAALGEAVEYDNPNSPVEYYLLKLKEAIEEGGGGGGGGFTPTTAQLAAMNSGITSEDVEQFSTNKTNILSVENIIISNQKRSVGFEQGVLDTDTGRTYPSNSRIRSGYIEAEIVKITPDIGTKYFFILYDSNNTYVPYESSWTTTTNIINIKQYGAAKIRVCVAKTDDANINTEYASHVSIHTNERLFNGTLEDLLITNINDCNNDGYYTIKAVTAPTISNYPANFTSRAGTIQVYRNITTNSTHTRFQIVTASNGATAFRYIRDNGTAGDWVYSDKTGFNWIALGDSITEGYYSTAPNTYAVTDRNWVKIASELMGCTVTNSGVGGSGYMDNTHATDNKNAKEKVNTINFRNFDVVTLAYGVNDWKYGYPLGDMQDSVSGGSSVIANMRYCIEKIISDNPLCKIIVVTPINCRGYDFSYGDESTNYGIGYTIADNGKTLQDFFDGMKTVCEYYGIDMMDLTHNSIVNRKSIVNLLKDGVHPSLECHKVLGHEIAKKIQYI